MPIKYTFTVNVYVFESSMMTNNNRHSLYHFMSPNIYMYLCASIIRNCQHNGTGTQFNINTPNDSHSATHSFSLSFVFKCAPFIFMITAHESIPNMVENLRLSKTNHSTNRQKYTPLSTSIAYKLLQWCLS